MPEHDPDSDLDFSIRRLGEGRIPSPLAGVRFTADDERVLYHSRLEEVRPWLARGEEPPAMEVAGARERLYFDPSRIAAGIVTCGGLCPGLNDVVRAIVMSLYHHYGVRDVYGFRYGYEGLVARHGHEPMRLTPDVVNQIHHLGGSILGSSRGPQDPGEMLQTLEARNVRALFAIGGDGTLRGAHAIAEEARRRGVDLAVVGIPKTIDNDVLFVRVTFGFETAVGEARRATTAAHAEAEAARNGVGLVKLMGRDSGFIAAFASLVDSHVNFCLIPEVPFSLERFLAALQQRIERRGHAVVVVAEGAGQDLVAPAGGRDASGNVRYGDIGVFLRDAIRAHFAKAGLHLNLKYIDPSYTIRSVPAGARDAAFCLLLGQCAVHAAMSGRTDAVIGYWNEQFTHLPIRLTTSGRKTVDPDSPLWTTVLASTGQPRDLR